MNLCFIDFGNVPHSGRDSFRCQKQLCLSPCLALTFLEEQNVFVHLKRLNCIDVAALCTIHSFSTPQAFTVQLFDHLRCCILRFALRSFCLFVSSVVIQVRWLSPFFSFLAAGNRWLIRLHGLPDVIQARLWSLIFKVSHPHTTARVRGSQAR